VSTIIELCRDVRAGKISATELVGAALASARASETTHAFIRLNPRALEDAKKADRLGPPRSRNERPLHGIPISVKDIFDVAGMETTCGSSFYAATRKVPRRDSAYVAAWRQTGAIIIGKTHLNEFAYGLTGENQTYGPCLQPADSRRLTGGSSSGAAASVLAGSSWIGIGTDTGGSIRVPAALCGLVGFRQSLSVKLKRGLFPLAPSFDTCGWLQRNLSDLAYVYSTIHPGRLPACPLAGARIAFLDGDWLSPCEKPIRLAFEQLLLRLRAAGATVVRYEIPEFTKAPEIFAAVQAYEAARIHHRFLSKSAFVYDPAIRSRLEWGLAMTEAEYRRQRREMATLAATIRSLWQRFDFLVAPASPFEKLRADEDHAARRRSLLQLTAPFSLAGLPALTFPWGPARKKFGWQILAPRGGDRRLVALASALAQSLPA
jgi:Asp-tRNA(Asn)/Glu-tRNA(Gln) amidotransferase A subunit family amidase